MKPHVRNGLAYIIPDVFWGLGWGIAIDYPLPTAYVEGIGASPELIGHLTLLQAAALGLPMLITGWLLAPLRTKRVFLIWNHVIAAGALLALAITLYFAESWSTTALAAVWLIANLGFFFMLGIGVPAWLGLLSDLFPSSQHARVLGLLFACNRAMAILGGLMAEQILGLNWAVTDQWSLLFAIAGTVMFIGSFPYAWALEQPRESKPRPVLRESLRSLGAQWRRLPDLRRFVYVDLLCVTGFVVLAFYGDAAIRVHDAPAARAGGWASISAGSQLAFALLIAVLGVRVRPRHWIVFAALVACAGAFLAGGATSLAPFGVVAGLSGAYLVIRNSCWAPQVLRMAPGEEGDGPIALAGAVLLPIQGVFTWTAGYVLDAGVPYRHVFFVVGALVAVGGVLCLLCVPDHGKPDSGIGKPDS